MTGAIFGALLHDDEIVAKIRAWPFETVLQLRAASVGERRAAGLRLTRSKLRALKGRTVGCVGCPPNWRTSGNVGEASDFLERRAHGRVPAAFWKNPEKNWLHLAKIQQNSGKICEFLGKKQEKKNSTF